MYNKSMNTGAVIAAAGLSKRMGQFKPTLPLKDSTIIRCCIQNYIDIDCSPIIVVTGREADKLEEHISDLPVECVRNPLYAQSDMFNSARIGLNAIDGRCSRTFFTPGDIPLIKPYTLKQMLDADADAVRPVYGGESGHPVLFDSSLISRITAYNGDNGLKGAFESLGVFFTDILTDDPGVLMDADTQDDYLRLLSYSLF